MDTDKIFYTRIGRIISLSIVIILAMSLLLTFSKKQNHQKNSFLRLLPSHMVTKMNALDIKYNSYYIAGLTSKNIYLGNYTSPEDLIITNYDLNDTQHVLYNFKNSKNLVSKDLKLYLDSPKIFITDNIHDAILIGNINSKNTTHFSTKTNNIIESVPISSSSFIFKKYDQANKKSIIGKENFEHSEIKIQNKILEKQIDGFFCTDGMTNFNKQSYNIIYVYYYRNEFFVIDTNLNLLVRGNTIDTNFHAKIKIGKISSSQTTLLEPPLIVNKHSCSDGEYLFIHSLLLAKNETKKIFDMGSAIDIYSTKNGKYIKSFYLPNYNGIPLQQFKVYHNRVVAINGNYILTFKIDL